MSKLTCWPTNRRRWAAGATTAVAALIAASCSSTAQTTTVSEHGLKLEAVSTRAEYVSRGDVLVRVSAPGATLDQTSKLQFTVDGKAATTTTSTVDGAVLAEITGLSEGNHTLRVTGTPGSATLDVTNNSIDGPLFSGPHVGPLVCTTVSMGLGDPTNDNCDTASKVFWRYVDTAGAVHDIKPGAPVPSNVDTATVNGKKVPLIVRTEEGVINRAVYWVSVVDPTFTLAKDDTAHAPPAALPGWNGRLVYDFGGGCGTTFAQGAPLYGTPAFDISLFRHGYAMATSTFNVFQVTCNDVLSAETAMMVKERAIELMGPADLTLGQGGSGGAIQQLLIAQNYPGILDAVVASVPFPDHLSIAPGVTDCGLMERYLNANAATWTRQQRDAVTGHATEETCKTWVRLFLQTIDPTVGCSSGISPAAIYNASTNPKGLRCTLQDANRNYFGVDPETGFARRPLDNVGIQYGFEALKDKVISMDQFLDLNEKIGGYDIDGQPQAAREEARPDDLRHVIENGRVNTGGGDLGSIPVMLLNLYSDPTGDIHDRFRMFTVRDRIHKRTGQDENVTLWTRSGGNLAASLTSGAHDTSVDMMVAADQWATKLAAVKGWKAGINEGHGTAIQRGELTSAIRTARPATAESNCVTNEGERLSGRDVYAKGACADEFPLRGNTRIAAGGPRTDDVAKCTLKAVDPADYGAGATTAQLDRLRRIFPTGVCDWSRPGVVTATSTTPWERYGK